MMIIVDLADEQEHLTEIYEDVTSCIPVLLENDEGLPLCEIYAPLLIEEDLEAMKRTRRPDEPSGSKTLDSVQGVFYIGEKLSTRILIKGEAGSGKSVFCLKLVESWCQLKQSPKYEHVCEKESELISQLQGNIPSLLSEWYYRRSINSLMNGYDSEIPCTTCEMQQCLSQFDLLYFVPLRDATEGKTSVVDMVCDAVCNDCPEEIDRTKRLLSNKNVRCLIVLDGVDEWPNPTGFTELPTTRGLSIKCVLLWTMRPWKLVHLELKPKHDDHIVTVCGLSQYSAAKVIENILVRIYGLKGKTLKSRFSAFCEKVTDKSLEGIMRMPMMLIAACHLWHRENASSLNKSLDTTGVGQGLGRLSVFQPHYLRPPAKQSFSVTHLYLELLDQMIQNAARKQSQQGNLIQNTQTSFLSDKEINPSTNPDMPIILRNFQQVCHYIDLLLPFCKLAFSDLMSAETKLVFNKGQLEKQLGKLHVDLAHRLGLISQAKLRGKYPQPNVSVSFYHKSVQELLAAVNMTCGPPDAVTIFCKYCSTLEKVWETANITKFVVGLDPSLGSRICEHITNVVNSDTDITEYRRTLDSNPDITDHGTGEDRVAQLYRTQCEWYKELTHVRTVTGDTSPPPSLHVTDIYLNRDSDSDDVRLMGELMYSNRDTIVSVSLSGVLPPLHGVAHYLPQCPKLSALCIAYMYNTENLAQIVAVIPRLTQLDNIRYVARLEANDVVAVLRLTQLRCIQLEFVILDYDDDVLVLTADWTRLHTVVLRYVRMSARSWGRFVSSLLTVPHPVDVTLDSTDIDADTVGRIQTSPDFTVTQDGGSGDSRVWYMYKMLKFTTVQPNSA